MTTPNPFQNPLQPNLPVGPQQIDREEFDKLTWEQQYESVQRKIIQGLKVNIGIKCPHHGPAPWAMGCQHVSIHTHDMESPEGAVFTPERWYLCKTCFKLFESKKFKLNKDLGAICQMCVMEFGRKLREINPELAVDLS